MSDRANQTNTPTPIVGSGGSGLQNVWDREYLGIVHAQTTQDFETHMLRLPSSCYVTAVMQAGDEDTLRSFLSPTASLQSRLEILTKVLASFVDRRLFITSPRPLVCSPEPCSLLVLAVAGSYASGAHLLAVCDVVSRPMFQGADDALRHATQPAIEYETIMQVVVRAVFDNQPTWAQCIDYSLPDLDAHYSLDEFDKMGLILTADSALADENTGVFSLLTQRTHYDAHSAYAYSTYLPGASFMNEWFRSSSEDLKPLVRAFLLGRIVSMPSTNSALPDYEQLRAILATGIPLYLCGGGLLPHATTYYDFCQRMQHLATVT